MDPQDPRPSGAPESALPPDSAVPDAPPPAAPAVPAAVVAPPGAGDSPAEEAGPRRGLAVLPLALLSLGALLLAAGAVFLFLQVQQARATDEARQEALAASRDAARALFSYDHETLEQDFEKGIAFTTGDFREEYSETTQNVVKDVATRYQAVVSARVNEAGVISAGPDEVVVLVFLNQVTTSTRVEGEKIDQSRVRMRLVERGGDWLVDRVDAL
jgi:Mce-associated membrane protein